MKRIINILFCFIAVLSTAACSDDNLDIQNENTLSTGVFWKTEDDVNSGLNAVYGMFYRQGTWTRNIYTQLNGMADDGVSYAGWTELNEWTKFKYTNYNFGEGQLKIWREHWTAINRANQVLDHIDDPAIKFTSESDRQDIKGQALWLRSFYYFYMTALWDNIPILTKTSSAADKPATHSADEVLEQIEKDLEEAVGYLPLTREKDKARPTKGAAYALLAKAYAQQKKWSDADRCLKWIIEGEGKSLYDLMPNWQDNFSNKTENNKESIYEIQFSLTHNVGFDQTDNYRDANAQLGTQIEVNQSPKGVGWNNLESNRWLVDYFKRERTIDGKNDPRLFYSCWYDQAQPDFPEHPNQLIYNQPWSFYDAGNRVFIKKYSTDAYPLYYWNDNNFRSLRLADMLLLYAEVLNEENPAPTAMAIECLNRVRTRVGLPTIQDSKYYDGAKIIADKAAFREHIKIERGLELAFECVRWIDLKRWGFDQANLTDLKARDADYNNFTIGKSQCLPIPQIDVDNNPNLKQNANY